MNTNRTSNRTDLLPVTIQSTIHPRKLPHLLVFASAKPSKPQVKVPKFHQMVFKTHKIFHQERTSSTQAFTIEVPTHSVPQLISILKEVANKDTKENVAFQMRKQIQMPSSQGAIRYQKHIIAN